MKSLLQFALSLVTLTQFCYGQWYQQNSGTTINLHAVHFIDENIGWAIGDSGLMLFSSNGGSNWFQQASGVERTLRDIYFRDVNTGWVVGGDLYTPATPKGIILKTTDGGVNWFQQISDTTIYLNAIFFVDQYTGWAVGSSDSIIFKTINGGSSWIPQPIFIENISFPLGTLNDVHFVNNDIGYIAEGHNDITFGGNILCTIDGGNTWNENSTSSIFYRSISFSNAYNGIAVGYSTRGDLHGKIYRKNDGGDWLLAFVHEGVIFNSIVLIDSNYAWTVGGTAIFFSPDKGANWIIQGEFPYSLNNVCFISSSTGWVVGDNGTILHTTNGGVSAVEEEHIDQVPTEFLLSQNYPNPFNPSTKIRYSVPQTSQVIIKVFDILGTEIETFVNEEKPAGTYELTWNAANLPSGIYFYQLKAGEFVQTKKMILLK